MTKVRIILWSIVAVAIAIVGGFWISERGQLPVAATRLPAAETVLADFELTDHNGMMRTDEEFRGMDARLFWVH